MKHRMLFTTRWATTVTIMSVVFTVCYYRYFTIPCYHATIRWPITNLCYTSTASATKHSTHNRSQSKQRRKKTLTLLHSTSALFSFSVNSPMTFVFLLSAAYVCSRSYSSFSRMVSASFSCSRSRHSSVDSATDCHSTLHWNRYQGPQEIYHNKISETTAPAARSTTLAQHIRHSHLLASIDWLTDWAWFNICTNTI